MIVNALTEGWEVITQRAHALLAAQLVAPWRCDQRQEPWMPLLAALVQHDDVESDPRSVRYLADNGTPLSFDRLPPKRSLSKERAIITNGFNQDIWVGLLLSRHHAEIFAQRRGASRTVDAFLNEQEELQRLALRQLGCGPDELDRLYDFMRFGDRLSLILCQRQTPDDGRRLEIGTGPGGHVYTVAQRPDGALMLEPDPYDARAVTVSAEYRLLASNRFADDAAFRRAVEETSASRLEWIFRT